MTVDDIDEPDVVAEVTAAFEAYEAALLRHDIAEMDRWFWDDPRVVRFGIADHQYGFAEVAAWRRTTTPVPADRAHRRVTVTAYGPDTAVAQLLFSNGDSAIWGRQTQVWVRFPNGWKITAAHVSMEG